MKSPTVVIAKVRLFVVWMWVLKRSSALDVCIMKSIEKINFCYRIITLYI